MTRVRDRGRNLRFRAWYARHILIDRRTDGDDGECEFWPHRKTVRRGYVPMTDLSILCLHNSTTSWESQQRGGIVEDAMGVIEKWVAVVIAVVAGGWLER